MPTVFLTGYESETIEQFLKKLKSNGITTVIDIREIPLSRKNGFSKIHLKEKLDNLGIKYYHFPKLGSPSKIRENLKTGQSDYLEFFQKYRSYVKNKKDIFRQALDIIINNDKTTLLCFEKDSDLCHRTIVASELLKLNNQMQVIPL